MVTGLILTATGEVSLGRERKRKVRALVDQFESLSSAERAWLKGTLAFCRDIEPGFVDRLVIKYGAPRLDAILASAD
jgi:RNA-directed DNA polymerase